MESSPWLPVFALLNQPSQKFCKARSLGTFSPLFSLSLSLSLSDGNKFQRRQSDKVKIPRSRVGERGRERGRSSSRHRQCTPISQTRGESAICPSSFFFLFLCSLRHGASERVYSQDCRSRSISNSDPRTARRPTARVPSHSLTPNCSLGGRGCSAKEPGGPDVTLPLSLSLFSRREIVMRLK